MTKTFFPSNAGSSIDTLLELLEDADIVINNRENIPDAFFQQMVNELQTVADNCVDMREEDTNHERRYALRELASSSPLFFKMKNRTPSQYNESTDFDSEWATLSEIINSDRLKDWLKATDDNWGGNTIPHLNTMIQAVKDIDDEMDELC